MHCWLRDLRCIAAIAGRLQKMLKSNMQEERTKLVGAETGGSMSSENVKTLRRKAVKRKRNDLRALRQECCASNTVFTTPISS
jgi:hypothetical protein